MGNFQGTNITIIYSSCRFRIVLLDDTVNDRNSVTNTSMGSRVE